LADLDMDLPVQQLSGGQKTKLAFASVLLERPSALLLDEPTNHLDARGVEWLEGFINQFRGAVLIVSHDRTLLNHTVSRILEVDSNNRNLNEYPGNYDDYVRERQKRMELQEQKYEQQQKEKKRLEQWLVLKRQEASVRPDPARGRQVRNMEKRIEREITSKAIAKPQDSKSLNRFSLKGAVGSGKLILRAEDICLNYGGKQILAHVNFELRGTQRALLSGANGSGKTTLLKIIGGEIKPDSGNVRIGDNINVGYFSQEHENLLPGKTVVEEFLSTERLAYHKDPRLILGGFLFTDEDINKKVSQLSLGERVRLIFCKLVHQENHLLLMDEPTNHLDISSKEVVEAALRNYEGAMLVVSHDRYFLKEINIDTELKLEGGSVKQYVI
jgi:ATP-binding cassette subfamily F protein 3